MKINRVIVWTLLLLLVENAIVPWLVPPEWSNRLLPHFAFIMTLFVSGFAGRHRAFLFGLGFGLLQDILFYGHLIGPYGFGMGLLGYAAGLVAERRSFSLGLYIWIVVIGSGLLDTIVYLIYKLFRLTNLPYSFVFYWQIAPTTLLQLLFALLVYVPVRRYLVKPSLSSGEDNSE
jgi:rod shape-determining protein MreD